MGPFLLPTSRPGRSLEQLLPGPESPVVDGGGGFWTHPGATTISALKALLALPGAEPISSNGPAFPRTGIGLLYASGMWMRRVRWQRCWATSMAWPVWPSPPI